MFAIGDRVEVIKDNRFTLEEGDKGIIIDEFELEGVKAYRVKVEGKPNYANLTSEFSIKLVE